MRSAIACALRGLVLLVFVAVGALSNAQEVTLTRDQLRGAAQQALLSNPAAARDLALILVQVDPEDPVAYRILAAAHFRLGDAELARAGARLAYRYAKTEAEKASDAVQAAQIAVFQNRLTAAQIWLRRAATHAADDGTLNRIAEIYGQVRARNPLSVSLGFGVTPSSNVNNGSDSSSLVIDGVPEIGLLSADAQALSGWEINSRLSLRYRLGESETMRHSLGATVVGRDVRLTDEAKELAPDAEGSDYSSRILQIDYGQQRRVSFDDTALFLALGARIGRAWSAGDSAFDFVGLTTRIQSAAPQSVTPYLTFGLEHRVDADEPTKDLSRGSVGLGLVIRGGEGARADTVLTYDVTDSEDINSSYEQVTLRTTYVFPTEQDWATFSTGLTLSHTYYEQFNSGIALTPGGRTDNSVYIDASAVLRGVSYAGFSPKVGLTIGRRDSNDSRFNIDEFALGFEIVSRF